MNQPQDVWTIVGNTENGCSIRIQRIEPEWDMLCTCEETQAVYRVHTAGDNDFASYAEGIRLVQFCLVQGENRLEEGFHMRPQPGTAPRLYPDDATVREEEIQRYAHMWTTQKGAFVLVATPSEKGTYSDGSTIYSIMKCGLDPDGIVGQAVSIAHPAVNKEVSRRMLAAGVAVRDLDELWASIVTRRKPHA